MFKPVSIERHEQGPSHGIVLSMIHQFYQGRIAQCPCWQLKHAIREVLNQSSSQTIAESSQSFKINLQVESDLSRSAEAHILFVVNMSTVARAAILCA
jgi:hypothetical protein